MFEKFIFYPLDVYLDDFDLLLDCKPLIASAISDNIFPCVLLKMTGAIEQKMKEISWQLAGYDIEFRREYLKDGIKDSYVYKNVTNIYRDIFLYINKNEKEFNINLDFFVYQHTYAFKKLKTKLQNLNYIYTTYRNFWIDFKNAYHYRFKELVAKIKSTKKKLENHRLCYNDKDFKNKCNNIFILPDYIGNTFNNAINARHRFAHNTFSYQARLSNITALTKEDKPENYFDYFFILLYVDKCLMHVARIMLEYFSKKWI